MANLENGKTILLQPLTDDYVKEILKEDGYDTEDDIRIWIEDIDIIRDEVMTRNEIEIIMNALAGTPTLTSSKFADKVERILKKFVR